MPPRKPGTMMPATMGGQRKKFERSESESKIKSREIWDDFSSGRKAKKKRAFEPGDDRRMVPQKVSSVSFAQDPAKPLAATPATPSREVNRDFGKLQQELGYEFSDVALLEHALTHRSALGVKERADYERLEFLGDAVLDLSVAHLLSDKYPDAREGELSKMRAALVNTQALADIAKSLDLGSYIRLGRGELASGGHQRPSILADVTEAVFGAMYRDCGYEATFPVVERIFSAALHDVTPSDPKTELQELLHVAGSEPPEYLLEMVEGPEHAPTFVSVVRIDDEIAGRGRGNTKKASQQVAASEAINRMIPSIARVELVAGQVVIIPELLLTAEAFLPTLPTAVTRASSGASV